MCFREMSDHVSRQACSSTTKNIISVLPQRLWFTKLGRVVTEGLLPIKSHDALMRWSYNITGKMKDYTMHTKLSRVATYLEVKACKNKFNLIG